MIPARAHSRWQSAKTAAPADAADAAYQYRIVGEVRLLFLWVTGENVGGARITFRQGVDRRRISLLIGSDPARAPRRINEWGYVREEIAEGSASVFGIRTLTDGESPREAEDRRTQSAGAAEFGVLCAGILPERAMSSTVTIRAPRDLTYRDTGRVLDRLERVSQFTMRVVPRPPDAWPGFLTALDRLMRTTVEAVRGNERQMPAGAFVYKDAVYDLQATRTELVPELRTRSRVFRDLLRSDMRIRNRQTGAVASFSVTYGTKGRLAGVVVAARYQPRWWFRIELALDDQVDVPPDPIDDPAINQQVQAVCARALGR